MLKAKFKFIRIITLLLIFVLTLTCLVACNGNEQDTDAATDGATEAPTQPVDDGINRIFENGDFACKIIRAEKASADERTVYDALRDALNTATGKRPRLTTDFLAMGESYNENEFAIIVGKTGYGESAELYKDLGFGECRIELIGRKLVIGFHDLSTALTAIEQLSKVLSQSLDNGSLICNDNMCFSYKTDGIIASLPTYIGGNIVGMADGGNGSSTAVIESTTEQDYSNYLSSLESEHGFTSYTTNKIGDNLFATYVSEKHTVTAIHTPIKQETRLIIELLDENPLPPTAPESYEVIHDSTITQVGLESTGRQNGMSYVVKLADGSFMIFDGGAQNCSPLLMAALEELADDPEHITIAAWVLTHMHNDHAFSLREIAAKPEYLSKLTVERFIWNRTSDKQIANCDEDLEAAEIIYQSILKFDGVIVHNALPGQEFHIRNAVYTVYSTSEMLEPFVMGSYNDSCVVGLLEIDGRRMFFPGDSDSTQTGNLVKLYGEELKCDLLQVIHHGHNGGNTTAYKLFDPIIVFWPVGMLRYEIGTEEYAPLTTWECNQWFFDENSSVEKIYVSGSEVVTLVIKEIPTH